MKLEKYRPTMTGEVLHSWAKDAQELIDELMAERQEWKCTIGNETFRTDDKSVAEEWRRDGLDVERYFVLSNAQGEARRP